MLCSDKAYDPILNNLDINSLDTMNDIAGLDYGYMLFRMVVALGIVLVIAYIALKLLQKYYGAYGGVNRSNRLISGIQEVYRMDRNSFFGILKVCDSYYLFYKNNTGISSFQILNGLEVEKYLGEKDMENED